MILPEFADKLYTKWSSTYAGIISYASKQNNWQQYLVQDVPTKGIQKALLQCLKIVFMSGY